MTKDQTFIIRPLSNPFFMSASSWREKEYEDPWKFNRITPFYLELNFNVFPAEISKTFLSKKVRNGMGMNHHFSMMSVAWSIASHLPVEI